MKLKIKDIVVTGENPRENFDEEKLRELGESIKAKGLLQPIIVRPREGRYELVVGERRYRACQLVGILEIEAEIRDIDDRECVELRLIENLHREDLTPSERDRAYSQYLMFIARERKYDLSDDKQYNQLIDEASRGTKLTGDAFRKRLEGMELSEIFKSANVELPRGVVDQISHYPSLGVAKQVRIAKIAQRDELSQPRIRKYLKEIYRNPDKNIETLIQELTLREEENREEEALRKKRVKEKALKPKKKSGRPRKKIKPNEFLEKLAAKKREKIEEIGEKAKESAIKREISALAKKRGKPSPPQVQIEGTTETKHKIILKDSREMHDTRDRSVHMMVTSPPYFNAPFDYRDHFESYDDFLSLIKKSAEEIYRVLQEGRVACINCDDMLVNGKKYPIVADVTKIFQETGFKYRDKLIWRKPEGYIRISRRSGIILQHPYPMYYYPDNIQESVLIFQKGNFDYKGIEKKIKELSRIKIEDFQSGKWNLSVWDIMNVSPPQSRLEKSIAAFPEELVKRLIILFSHVGETVLDPFLGSGTTTKVAYELGRNSVGYEMDKKLLEVIKKKVGITKENKHQFEILGV